MPQYKGLSINQHQEIAAELLAVQEKVRQIFFKLLEAYGPDRRVTRCAHKLLDEVDTFTSEMNTAYFSDMGQEAPHTPYYPSRKS